MVKTRKEVHREFRAAAFADGWVAKDLLNAQYRLEKQGFVMFCDENQALCAWGPDGLAIILDDDVYSWNHFISGLSRCNLCNAKGVTTFRYSFAGRCCLQCLPGAQKEHEFRGWTD
jgi:hypothetical protein